MIIKTVPQSPPPPEMLQSVTLNESEAKAVFSLIGCTSIFSREEAGLTHASAELLTRMYNVMMRDNTNFLNSCDKKGRNNG
jgi:hypothetical protein